METRRHRSIHYRHSRFPAPLNSNRRSRSRERSLSARSAKRPNTGEFDQNRSSTSRRERSHGRPNETKMEFHSHSHNRPGYNSVIAVFGLMDSLTESDLREMFMPFGKIQLAAVVMNPRTGRSRGGSRSVILMHNGPIKGPLVFTASVSAINLLTTARVSDVPLPVKGPVGKMHADSWPKLPYTRIHSGMGRLKFLQQF
ncbi:unnamed protein product [Allacma fusca]|uniref:RRM domain-containing protein n=1 Tax=Allacma fusca TaxID=39272 RepID=A0A8J2NUI8_9HEXA|nr:unnamed protein product [Allacma fusca]